MPPEAAGRAGPPEAAGSARPAGPAGPAAPARAGPRRAAVLGKPVAHSRSPDIHRAGYAAAGLAGWSYTAVECAESELAGLVAGLGAEWAGVSLTMPLKEVALRVASSASALATTLGAANTLVRQGDGGWHAENTDAPGMADALRPALAGAVRSVAVLGAGGTARAALAAAAGLGAASATVYARRPAAVAALDPVAAALGLPMSHGDWARVAAAGQADVVVSTVPKGAADPVAPTVAWGPSTVLLDALYDPWPTALAASAARAGRPVVSGLELLLAQAVRQFTLFTGVPAPVAAMRAALGGGRAGDSRLRS
ncbi:MAG TPA: shikimate dehydrogenase [Micromonosporaceae bacterium]|nr:shikimate dehydrogenase [Micromonosporaceae bacterium]